MSSATAHAPLPSETDWRRPYRELLATWCRGLVAQQVSGHGRGLDGGLLCPACARIHGRCADAVHPLLLQARLSGDLRFRDAAARLLDWSEAVATADGAWTNEVAGHEWKGITVFSVVALGEALRHHGELLDDATRARWRERLRRGASWIAANIEIGTANINYPVAAAAALASADAELGEPRWRERARLLFEQATAYVSERDAFPWGEGPKQPSPRGLRAIDVGYNVEETLPLLAHYGRVAGDERALALAARCWPTHLALQLPDGGWDAGWSMRSFKWTWWGSRTADGCQGGLMLLADRDPRFAPAAARNLALLARCTHDGLLHGGPHHHARGHRPCIHHTFCHARALAEALDLGVEPARGAIAPEPDGIRELADAATAILRRGPWRATVTAYDHAYHHLPEGHPSGGSLCLLWHDRAGALASASMVEYSLAEASNMEAMRSDEDRFPLTPRLELRVGGRAYRSDLDRGATLTVEGGSLVAAGRLVDAEQRGPPTGSARYRLRYAASDEGFTIQASGAAGADFILPMVALAAERASAREGAVEIRKADALVRVACDAGLRPLDLARRVYNPVPGFEVLPLAWRVPPQGLELRVAVRSG